MPMVENWVRQMSGKEPLRGVNVDEAVSLGAAIQAGVEMQKKVNYKLGGQTSSNQQFRLLGSKKIVDVMSHSLGAVAVSEDGEKYIGISVSFKNEYDLDPEIDINFKKAESGSSGGLITTLEIYNQLTKKDLTNGLTIAGTGTIESDGTIGEIGGIEHKIYGAVKGKADIFLTPGGDNYKDAKKYIKENKLKIKLIKVDTIQGAINQLEDLK